MKTLKLWNKICSRLYKLYAIVILFLEVSRTTEGFKIRLSEDSHQIYPIGQHPIEYCAVFFLTEWQDKVCYRLCGSVPLVFDRKSAQKLASLLFGGMNAEVCLQTIIREQPQSIGAETTIDSCHNYFSSSAGNFLSYESKYCMVLKNPGLRIQEFPLKNTVIGDRKAIQDVLRLLGQAAMFYTLVASCFSGKSSCYGTNKRKDCSTMVQVVHDVDVARQPDLLITTNMGSIGSQMRVKINVDDECELTGTVELEESGKNQVHCNSEMLVKLLKECHCIPLVMHFLTNGLMALKCDAEDKSTSSIDNMTAVTLDIEPASAFQLDSEDILLDSEFGL